MAVRPEKVVEAILGEQRVSGVQLAGGETVALDGVFVALGVAGSTALARKLGGAEVDGNRIVTDEHMMTTLPGLYAAGDCTGGLLQVAKRQGLPTGFTVVSSAAGFPRQSPLPGQLPPPGLRAQSRARQEPFSKAGGHASPGAVSLASPSA